MDARQEARARVGGGYDARVLEPSPPSTTGGAFADDPLDPGDRPTGDPLVVPLSRGTTGAQTWQELASGDTELAEWCAARWLAAWRPLPEPPATLATTRAALHAIAERVLSPARHAATGKIGLRYTAGGFGTPFYETERGDTQVRVSGDALVVQTNDEEQQHALTTLRAAAATVGVPPDATTGVYEPTSNLGPDDALVVDEAAAVFVGSWFGFSASVLEQLRAEAAPDDDASLVQLWPEHFDLAVEIGAAATRGAFGCSPGDDVHPDPYLYVTHWNDVRPDSFWNDAGGSYASLPLADLRPADDHRDAALTFFRAGRERLRS